MLYESMNGKEGGMEGEMKGGREGGASLMKEIVMAGIQSFSSLRLRADVNQQNEQKRKLHMVPTFPSRTAKQDGKFLPQARPRSVSQRQQQLEVVFQQRETQTLPDHEGKG